MILNENKVRILVYLFIVFGFDASLAQDKQQRIGYESTEINASAIDRISNTEISDVETIERPEFEVHGVKIFVDDLTIAEKFYSKDLGFKVIKRNKSRLILETNTYPVYLQLAKQIVDRDLHKESYIGLSFQVTKLLPAIDELRASGIHVQDSLLSRNGVGIDIPFHDPTGNILNLIEVQIRDIPEFNRYRVYNSGAVVNDMIGAENFYKGDLGFLDWSRDYLPDALPLMHKDGSFAFMLHQKKGLIRNTASYGTGPQIVLMFEVSNFDETIKYFKQNNIPFQKLEKLLVLKDPEGNHSEIIKLPF